ncbi:MAG: biosynthetic-type acetolactate synthase large subunit [Porphyromonadaceae bacterium]|nr:MAG: biosynthetic-type acetolactate synthase large subunit [Porphyromonadaceae bacterium]
MSDSNHISGADAIILALQAEGVETLFGYPGGAIMPLYDAMFRFGNQMRHVLTRHEQGAIHAAQGFARVSGKTGVCITTSGPGATNLLTGLADAFADSTPVVCITGQVNARLIGSDAFQEADILGLTTPVTKWNIRITCSEDLLQGLSQAFYIARTGRPGPVVVDIAKNVLLEKIHFDYQICAGMPSYHPEPVPDDKKIRRAADWINQSERPILFWGQGVLLANASNELRLLIDKAGLPAASTLLGLSAIPADHPLNMGMLGMHGNYAPNVLSAKADLIVAVGMRFDDRVTSDPSTFLPNARVIHIDIDASEHGKVMQPHLAIVGDAARVLRSLLDYVEPALHADWVAEFRVLQEMETDKVMNSDLSLAGEKIQMGAMIRRLSERFPSNTLVVTDVGQHQMKVARYYKFNTPRSMVTSGGLGTMGFGLPAAIGAKIACPDQPVLALIGDGGFQMTMQEIMTIVQEKTDVKVVLLNNGFLGMVRQWQELFFAKRYASTELLNPDFVKVVDAMGLPSKRISTSRETDSGIDWLLTSNGPCFLEVVTDPEENVFPMVPPGVPVSEMWLEKKLTLIV